MLRPPGRDPFGDPLPGSIVEFDVAGCLVAPGPSRELGLGANQTDSDATVYAPPGVDIRATDRIRVAAGTEYAVVGEPQDWGSSGVVVVLRSVTG